MARTPAQRGRVGNWLVESRMARGWATQEKARGEIERLTGWRIPQSVYAEWESGRRTPTEANLERLREFYGQEEKAPPVGEAGLAAMVAAIEAQTRAIEDLANVLREGQDRQTGAFDGLADGLLALLAQLTSERAEQRDGPAPQRAAKL